ncbi:DUF397 domain-containing protein [Actinomadura sp. 6N118]|uniref:DUF397 domain-containing protein n=1 Tax=Actinomadura sp. 6N118 TaxID=3375151 RepID=UPI00378C0789
MNDRVLWRKSKRSSTQGGECVEVSTNTADVTLIRDSKAPASGHLALGSRELAGLMREIKAGRYDG